jgi:hypothetical protein
VRNIFLYGLLGLPMWGAINVPLTIQEAVYPGSIAGVSRAADPVTVGIPLPDDTSTGATDVSQLGLSGASVGQFRVLGRWPSGRIKWVLVDTQASLAAGQKNISIALTPCPDSRVWQLWRLQSSYGQRFRYNRRHRFRKIHDTERKF